MARRRSRTRSRFRDYSGYEPYGGYGGWGGFAPYVSVAARRAQAQGTLASLRQSGKTVSPVEVAGRKIATTFWGSAWCDNLESYSDFANRIPRGRSYVRNGSVLDLQIGAGQVEALVSGSSIYTVKIGVTAVAAARWKGICTQCAGGIDTLVELLQGRFSKAVMAHLCQQGTGLFPTPGEVSFSCSCPDWASMCKHVAAALYGVGARLDRQPDLLFRLRQVDELELITHAGSAAPLARKAPAKSKVLADKDLAGVFGVELAALAQRVVEPKLSTVAPGASRKAGKPERRAARPAEARTTAKKKVSVKKAAGTKTRKPAKKQAGAKLLAAARRRKT